MCDTNVNGKVVCICGVKNSGKTTYMGRLIREFTELGYKVAAIKHDGHDFLCDTPGTDSFKYHEAGAYGTAVYSGYRLMLMKELADVPLENIISFYKEADIILIEGLKNSPYPKIELVRKDISTVPVSNSQGRFLIVTDADLSDQYGEVRGFEQIHEAVQIIQRYTPKKFSNLIHNSY